jgi:hypothetical protein
MEVHATDITARFQDTIRDLQGEPDFQWRPDDVKYAVNGRGEPDVQLAVGNVPLDYDLWAGLRNPALVGLHPAGLPEIWAFHANRRKSRVDAAGRSTIFQIPQSYDYARTTYRRAVIISVMLPFSPTVLDAYVQGIRGATQGSSYLYARMYRDANLMINTATSRVAMDLVTPDRVVVAMDDTTVKDVSTEAIPLTHQGVSHGPSKGGNYPQKSLAVLLGLGQFGIHRLVFRDEYRDGDVTRYFGPIRSIVIFDKDEVVRTGRHGVMYPTPAWRDFLFQLSDFTHTDQAVNQYRFCSYIPLGDEGCGKCIGCCPSGAQPNSTPTPQGQFSEQVKRQIHRFWDGCLQFDYARCCEDRGQLGTLFPEWSCTRCLTVCVTEGSTRPSAAKAFYTKLHQLTTAE